MSSPSTDRASDSEAQDRLTMLAEHAALVLAAAALDGLADVAAGHLLNDCELDQALAGASPRPER